MAKYVDINAVKEAVRRVECDANWDKRSFDAEFIENALDFIPSADVAPVVHGRWDGNDCTVCKLPWNYNMVQDADDWGYFDPMPDYCPNCGPRWMEMLNKDGLDLVLEKLDSPRYECIH